MISVLLPTIRPSHIDPCISALEQASCEEFEIVVVADFPAGGTYWPQHVTWIQRQRQGVVDAVNIAYKEAKGEWLFLHNDESWLEAGALDILLDAAVKNPRALYAPRHEPRFNFSYYGLFFAAFPFGHRRTFDRLGGMLDSMYRGFYADPDLSMRAHKAGVPVIEVHDAVLHHANNICLDDHQRNVQMYLAHDREVFRSRWDYLGEFKDPA